MCVCVCARTCESIRRVLMRNKKNIRVEVVVALKHKFIYYRGFDNNKKIRNKEK